MTKIDLSEETAVKRTFTASVLREGDWFVAQCLEVDVASQGESEAEALANLREALELYFEDPQATAIPQVRHIEVEVSAA
jgi:predicted RNase H-like HicB family nuclease